jgi:peptidylprolyl isomerase
MSILRVRHLALTVVLGAAGALGLAACSSSPSNPSSTSGSSGSSAAQAAQSSGGTSTTNPAGGGGAVAIAPIPAAQRSPAGSSGTAPTVTVPPGAPPSTLESSDLIAGTGNAAAAPGASVTVQYVLATYSSGKVIQSSWTSQPFTFTLGAGQVIPGWDKGVVGMRVGGRRELIIPPSLGYGSESPGAGIAPNDTLVFVIDLLKVN